MLNKSLRRQAQESVDDLMRASAIELRFERSKAEGTFVTDVTMDLLARIAAGSEHGRTEVSSPAGFEALHPQLYHEDPMGSAVTALGVITIPGVTPGQAFAFSRRYTAMEQGEGLEKTFQVFAPNHRTFHAKPNPSSHSFFSTRDACGDHVWKRVLLPGGSTTFIEVSLRQRSERNDEELLALALRVMSRRLSFVLASSPSSYSLLPARS